MHAMVQSSLPVLIVSRHESVRSELKQVLHAHGMETVAFDSGADYLASSWPVATACLILDVELADMSGLDLLQRLGAASPPVLFVARSAELDHAVRAIKAGAIDFLTSPFEAHRLMSNVRNALALDSSTRANREKISELQARFARLTPREAQVFERVVGGALNKQVAADLGISNITVQIHRRRVMRKMRAPSFAELVRIAGVLGVPLQEPAREPLETRVPCQTGSLASADVRARSGSFRPVRAGRRRERGVDVSQTQPFA